MDTTKDKICPNPFEFCEIHGDGKVFPCCPTYCKGYYFGNLNDAESFYEIWNSKRAKSFREKMLRGDFSCCNLKVCAHLWKLTDKEKIKDILNSEYPKNIKICYDRECNVACIMCRNKIIKNTEKELEKLKLYESKIIPIVDKLEEITLSGSGDPFGSRYCRELIKKIAEKNKKIIFNIHSNGMLMTEKMVEDLGIKDRIGTVTLSIHAASEKTYNKVVKYSNFKMIKKNIEWLSKAKREKRIRSLAFIFVINNFNYVEIPDFVKMADKYSAGMYFSLCRDWGSDFTKNFGEVAIWKKEHPKHRKFLKIINNPIFKDKRISKERNISDLYNTSPEYYNGGYNKFMRTIKVLFGRYHI